MVEVLSKLQATLEGLASREPVGEPDRVSVRVLRRESYGEVIPLPCMRVRMMQQRRSSEAMTDAAGVASLLPPVGPGGYRVEVRVDGRTGKKAVGATARGTLEPGEAPLHPLEVDFSPEVEAQWARTRRWQEAVARATDQVEALRQQAQSALPAENT